MSTRHGSRLPEANHVRPSPRLAALRGIVAAERPAIAAIAAVAFAFALFRLMVTAGIPQDPRSMLTLASGLQKQLIDFAAYFVSGLVMLSVIQPVRRLGPSDGRRRVVAIGIAIATAATLATFAILAFFAWAQHRPFDPSTAHITFVRLALLATLLTVVGEFHRGEVQSLEAMRAAEADRAALEQQTLKARLKTLEAQIEPHFLFNTLATVRRLYETDAAAGEAMLGRLMRYLQMALPAMRSDRSTLAREAELVAAYLDLQQVRMGRRLAFRLDVAPGLGDVEVPPMMLLTLVENAIKHGLAPKREGGRIDVEASSRDGELHLAVSDSGRGFGSDSSGGGTGLANIRARLQAMFGSAGELTLSPRQPHGIEAAIRMPLPAAAS